MSRRGGRVGPGPNVSLYIKNLSYRTEPEVIRSVFEKYGPVSDVHLPKDYYTKERRGFGYVQFTCIEDAEDALDSMTGREIDGKIIHIEFAQGDRKTPTQMRGKDPYSERDRDYDRGYDRDRGGRDRYHDDRRSHRRRSPSPYYRRRDRSSDRYHDDRRRSPPRRHSRSRSRGGYETRRRSPSPPPRSSHRSRSRSPLPPSPRKSRSPLPPRSRSRSPPPAASAETPRDDRSRSPARHSRSPPPANDHDRRDDADVPRAHVSNGVDKGAAAAGDRYEPRRDSRSRSRGQ